MIRSSDWPIASAAECPNIVSAARFQNTIMPSRSDTTTASGIFSMMRWNSCGESVAISTRRDLEQRATELVDVDRLQDVPCEHRSPLVPGRHRRFLHGDQRYRTRRGITAQPVGQRETAFLH